MAQAEILNKKHTCVAEILWGKGEGERCKRFLWNSVLAVRVDSYSATRRVLQLVPGETFILHANILDTLAKLNE